MFTFVPTKTKNINIMKTKTIIFLIALGTIFTVKGQKVEKELENQANLVFGLSQISLGGFNIEGNLFYKRFTFDYSHGASLNFVNETLEEGNDKSQQLAIHMPWTTGFGVGYRFNNWLNLRVEPKMHKYELYHNQDRQNSANLIGDYTTFTLGLGLYANLKPFKNQTNFLKGFMIAPSARWWPNISSSLASDQLVYNNKLTGAVETHNARNVGIANSPFLVNLSVGYSISF